METNLTREKSLGKKYLHFEGLRGIAAFIVFIAHFRPSFCLNINDHFLDKTGITGFNERTITEHFLSLFYEGSLPVFVFWFMSAYVISIKLFDLRRNANNIYLTEAATKRYFRLAIPVFASSLICFILMKANLIYNVQLAEQLGKGYVDGWLNQQYHFEPGIIHFVRTTLIEVFMDGNCHYNFVLWTMSPELLGSFLCFGLFALIGRNKYRFPIYITTIVFLMFGGMRDIEYQFYLAFVAGIMWCDAIHSADEGIIMKENIRRIFTSKIATLFLLIFSFAVPIFSELVKTLPKNFYHLFNLPVKAIAVTLMIANFDLLRKLFSIRLFTFLGKISFSLYLLHLPLIFSLGGYLYLYAGIAPEQKVLIIFLILTAVLILLSYFFEKIVDRKSVVISDKIGKFFSSQEK